MYMGVILFCNVVYIINNGAPHVYGGDPERFFIENEGQLCSPCIWG